MGYCDDPFNTFDAVVVTVSVVEVMLQLLDFEGGVNVGALRTLRLARAFKLARSFDGLRRMIGTMLASVNQVCHTSRVIYHVSYITNDRDDVSICQSGT